jgi:hypothetical protein
MTSLQPKPWKRALLAVLAVAVPTALVLGSHAADASTNQQVPPGYSARAGHGKWSGEAAIARLGTGLGAVAASHGMSDTELRKHLREDRYLRLDDNNQLLYADPAAAGALAASTEPTPLDPTIAPASAFVLSSRPGAARTIYLDFDGHTLSGTAWNGSMGGDCYAEPFDADGTPASFSDAERNIVISVWRRVSEDYAPFDVNVTTMDPGYAAINRASSTDTVFGTRVLITKSIGLCPNGQTVYAAACGSGCGGVAYVGVLDSTGSTHDYYQPAFVFQNGVGTNGKYIAEAASHEAGHNAGLSHDGTATAGYYTGHGSWAPIMGVGYSKAITQWSKGEYSGASQFQDDFVMAASNGLALRADDHGNSAATATPIVNNSTVDGVIHSASDVDAFTVTAGAGTATFSVSPAPVSPNLDVRLEVRAADGTVVAVVDPASGSSNYDAPFGLGASTTLSLAAGTYTLLVDGVGFGDPLSTGYSDYGSLGNYRISVNVAPTSGQPPVAVASASVTSGVAPLAVNFAGSTSSDPDGGALTYAWNFGDGVGTSTLANPSYSYSNPGTYTAVLRVTDESGLSASASVNITVSAPVRQVDLYAVSVTGTRNASTSRTSATGTVGVRDSAGVPVSGASVTVQWYIGTRLYSTRTGTTNSAGTGTFGFSNVKIAKGVVVKLCVTKVSLAGGAWNASLFSAGTGDCASWTTP